jgi:drug/metabolite transporter (DMT)-like permease
VTRSIGEDGLSDQPNTTEKASGADERPGPDPVVGAGITLLGIFLMGTGGAKDAHYVFDFGVLTAVLGAAIFVVCVALSAIRRRDGGAPAGGP